MLTITAQELAVLSNTTAPQPGVVKDIVARRDLTVPCIYADGNNPTPVNSYDVCHRNLVFTGSYSPNAGIPYDQAPPLPQVTCLFPRGTTKVAAQAALAAISSAVGASSLFS